MTKKFNLMISYLLFILLIVALGIISYLLTVIDEKNILLNKYTVQDKTLLSMMIENENGEYEESKNNEWPGERYILNKDRSGCENGGTLEYQDNNVYVKASSSDRCYVYFAIDNFENRCALNYEESLACDLIENKDNSLIYHDGKADYENMPNSNLEADDLSYRFVGENPNNYVCFGGDCSNEGTDPNYKNLYRIIGLFKNEDDTSEDYEKYEAKIIKADAATATDLGDSTYQGSSYYGTYYENDGSQNTQNYKGKLKNYGYYYWNNTDSSHAVYGNNNNVNMWKDSNLNTRNLNEKFYNAIDPTYQNMVVEHKWQVGGYSDTGDARAVYDYELGNYKLTESSNNCYTQGNIVNTRQCNGNNDLTYSANVGLMYMSDYMYATLPEYYNATASDYAQEEIKNNDWLYLGIYDWAISRYSNDGTYARFVNYSGSAGNYTFVYSVVGFGARPVVYLSSDVKIIGGSGTDTSPYKISY